MEKYRLEADGWNLRVCGNAMYLNIYGVLKEIYRKVENNELGRKRYQTLGGGFDHCGMSRKTKTGGVVVQKRLIGVTRYKKDVWFEVSNTTHHQLNRIHYLKPGSQWKVDLARLKTEIVRLLTLSPNPKLTLHPSLTPIYPSPSVVVIIFRTLFYAI